MTSSPRWRPALALAALTALLAACGGSNGPSSFDPEGSAADATALNSVFQAPSLLSFSGLVEPFGAIAGTQARAAITALTPPGGSVSASLAGFARAVPRLFPAVRSGGLSADVVHLPSTILGKTYEFDVNTSQYVAGTQTGAPSNGVRFLLYAVNPVTRQIATPLNQIGYADFLDEGTSTTTQFEVIVVSQGVTYADYTLSGSGTPASGQIALQGFVTDGTTRLNINLSASGTDNGTTSHATLDYHLDAPSRSLTFALTADITTDDATENATAGTVGLTFDGPHGNVVFAATIANNGGTGTVTVNGSTYATFTSTSSSSATFTGANGQPLTDAQKSALGDIFLGVAGSIVVFAVLVFPLAGLVNL